MSFCFSTCSANSQSIIIFLFFEFVGLKEIDMRRLRIYVDTSVFGGLQDSEFESISKRFFDIIRNQNHLILVSEITLAELSRAPEIVRGVYEKLPDEYVNLVNIDEEVNNLARAYIEAGILGKTHSADATHVATATIARADMIVSWNFKHIVNFNRIHKLNAVNMLQGYRTLEIHSPLEIDYEQDNKNI